MWKLETIHAENLCSFKELDYSILQGHTTLIFGNNMDNDSQGSNGSGKSAMLEAIAIGLIGEPLRKIRMEEIINDAEDTAVIELVLSNDFTGQIWTVKRTLHRKSPQEIDITMNVNGVCVGVVEATVADYNRYILSTIGLTKDDIYTNFILSKHKYESFLSSSDKDKKELINRFSNGILVDESIEALQQDITPVQDDLKNSETVVANYTGRVSAIDEQISAALNEATERSQKKAERLKNWEEKIADKRKFIREQNNLIDNANSLLEQYDELDAEMQGIENSDKSVSQAYKMIMKRFEAYHWDLSTDYAQAIVKSQELLKNAVKNESAMTTKADKVLSKLESLKKTHEKLQSRYSEFQKGYSNKYDKATEKIDKFNASIEKLERDGQSLKNQRTQMEKEIAEIEHILVGAITCPKCSHQFVLGGDVDVAKTKETLRERQYEVQDIANTIQQNQQDIDNFTLQKHKVSSEQDKLVESKSEWSTKIAQSQEEVNQTTSTLSDIRFEINELQNDIEELHSSIKNARKTMFDDVYVTLDDKIGIQERVIKQAELEIDNAEGAIRSYEESIKDLQNASETDIIASLNESKDKYEKLLSTAISYKESIEQRLLSYKAQEATFIEFKTHLANSKIDALGKITNEFLEAIGSDIRIAFSGYTVLKSGKIRDKISISLIREGVDCGSFDKFSEGEKTRVNLANILAMHKLTNLNCDEGKGLDLLVLDEILEATDEQGLSKIFDALNQLKITSLVVSHGNIAEGYPYKTVVNKQNGISYING